MHLSFSFDWRSFLMLNFLKMREIRYMLLIRNDELYEEFIMEKSEKSHMFREYLMCKRFHNT